jgi:4-aminobutyrate aminotransferase
MCRGRWQGRRPLGRLAMADLAYTGDAAIETAARQWTARLAARKELMSKWTPGSHGGTFGGNVVACAAAVATIQAMREEKLVENAAARGKQLVAGLHKLQAEFPQIGDVRGMGLMVGVEFGQPGAPDAATAKAVIKAAFGRGLMLLSCGTFDNVIRWIPPLVVTEEQMDEALNIFAAALDQVIR